VTQPDAVADRSSFVRISDALAAEGRVATSRADQVYARCPAHDDSNASLSVTWRVDSRSGAGRTYVKCHTGCDTRDVLAALGGMTLADLYDTPAARPTDARRSRWAPARGARKPRPSSGDKKTGKGKGRQRVVAVYPYCDADGAVIYEVTRWEPKEFTVRRTERDSRGRRIAQWPARDRRVLYRLPEVTAAVREGRHVFVTEGEKDADALAAVGVVATCNAGGAAADGAQQDRWLPQYTAALTGARVVIVCDNDDPGRQHAAHLHSQLADVAESVTVVRSPFAKDAADHLAAGHGLDEFEEVDPATLDDAAASDEPTADEAQTSPSSTSTAPTAPAPAVAPVTPPADADLEETAPVNLSQERRRRRSSRDGITTPPSFPVNVTFGLGYAYSIGDPADDHERGIYERKRDSAGETYWLRRAGLPFAHARIVRRDGTRRRIGTELLLSLDEHGDRVVVTDDELADGRWAVKLGANLSSDRNIITAAATAIRDLAHRFAPEQEATPRPQAHTETGHVDIPVAECMPNGYLSAPPRIVEQQRREVMREVVALVARHAKMALTMGASAGAPYVGPLRRQSHWWDLYGDSRKGKSTTQAVAASLWGDPRIGDGIVMGWDATSIGTGRFLGQLGILPPFFDERGLASFDKPRWGEMIYSTCQGSSRLKAESDTAQGTVKSVPWFGVLFSTGNDRLTDGIAAGRFAGIPARVVELAAPFTENHTEAKALVELAGQSYGWLGPAILAANTVHDVAELVARAEHLVGVPEAGGVPGTIAEHLHMAVAGAMMIDAELGTGAELTNAAVTAAREHLDANAHEPKHDADRMIEALAESMTARRSAWPTMAEYIELGSPRPTWNPDAPADGRRPALPQHGFDQQINGIVSDDERWLYVFPSVWRAIADDLGLDSAVACRKLHERGHLHVSEARKRAGEWQAGPRVNGRVTRVYQLSLFAFDLDDDQAADTQPLDTPPTDTTSTDEHGDGQQSDDQDPAEGQDAVQRSIPELQAVPDSPSTCTACSSPGAWCGLGAVAEDEEPCVHCGAGTRVRAACGQPRHADCTRPPAVDDEDPDPTPPATAPTPSTPPSAQRPAPRPSSPRASVRKGRQSAALDQARAELAKGADDGALRLLADLEGPFAPLRRGGPENRLRQPRWRPEHPGMTWAAHIISSWGWSRRYKGDTVTLDRSGAFVAAASSVQVAHGELEHTGPLDEFEGRPGYYQVQVHPWHFSKEAPHPLHGAHRRETAWVPAPTVALLVDLHEQDRWADVTILDSYTAEGARLSKWTEHVNQLRREAITTYGRESEQYAMVKEAFGMALSLMLGSPRDSGTGRVWRCAAQRPDWTHTIQAQASATIYRWAEACRQQVPAGLGPVALRNVDELVIPAEALDIVTSTERPGGLPPMKIDPDGIKLGTFKVKNAAGNGDG
jgi:hypothetical protein